MRIKEIMERVDPAYNPDAGFGTGAVKKTTGFLQNVGRAGLDRFTRSQLGVGAYDDEQEAEQRKKRAAQQAAPQTAAANTQSVAPNFAQGTAGRTTVNAPTATVPAIRPYIPQAPAATTAAPVQTPAVNPAAPPEVYYLDNRPLNPNNPIHSKLIAQLQQQGITQAKTGIPKK
jgi:hypothetical protein